MNVFFGTTTAQLENYKEYYHLIIDYIKHVGCIVPYDWLPEAEKFYKTGYKERNITEIFNEVISAINKADAVVIEYTVPNFSSSHQIHYAQINKKPTLVMRLKKDNPRFSDSYLEAYQSPFLTIRDYSKDSYKEVLDEFFGIVQMGTGRARYNIVLSSKERHYLDWATIKYHRSRSAIIRELVDKRSSSDSSYKQYFRGNSPTSSTAPAKTTA